MAAQRRGSESESVGSNSVSAPSPLETGSEKVHRAPGGQRTLKVVGTAVLLLAALSLCASAGLLSRREAVIVAPPRRYAEPVDRSRSLRPPDNGSELVTSRAVSSGAVSGRRVISVEDLSRKSLGSAHEAEWPLFWVMTAPKNEQTRCQEIIASWGRHVPPDSLVFIGSEKNWTTRTGHQFIALGVPPEMKSLKEFLSWQYVARVYPEREWFVKGDDDTYFIVNNMNRYLEEYDPRLPYFLGCKFHLGGAGGVQYVSGGAGYVLSKVSAHRLAGATDRCLRYYGRVGEGDLAIAECLQTVGVVPEDTRDERGRQRFHAFPYDYHANWYKYGFHVSKFWYHDWVWGPEIEGTFCCDDNTTVSFHYMADHMVKFAWPAPKGLAPLGMKGGPGLGTAPTLVPPVPQPQLPGGGNQLGGGFPGGFLGRPSGEVQPGAGQPPA